MADKPKDKGGKKPSAPSGPNGTEIIIGLLAALLGITLLFGFLQKQFAGGGILRPEVVARNALFVFSSQVNEYTPAGARVRTKEKVDVWETSALTRIKGVHEEGVEGALLSKPVALGNDLLFEIDFDTEPDGWVYGEGIEKQISGWAATTRRVFLWISGIVTLLGACLALYSWRKWLSIMRAHKAQMQELEKKLVGEDISSHNERWERVETLAASENPGDWRVAIIEADVLLDELVTSMGYDGEGLGDKLKAIEKSDFVTLDDAWDAHKIRNRIAHSGSDFILTHRETKRVIELFRNVFREFDYI